MRMGIATIPLDYGRCPTWLFEKMKRLSRGIVLAICEEFGPEEFLRRISDPIWFQSLGCVIGFDWNSSGLTTTTLAALKEGLRGLELELGIFICGGKGKTSRKTPQQIQNWGEFLGFPTEKIDKLIYASRISAKVDNTCLQDGFQLYHHNLIFSKSGHWTVIQQGMNEQNSRARRYHWLGWDIKDFVEQPHSGIISQEIVRPLNLTAKESSQNRKICFELVKEEPKTFLKDFKTIITKKSRLSYFGNWLKPERLRNFTEVKFYNKEFHWHPVLKEKFDLKRLEKTIFAAHSQNPENFEKLLSLNGIGPKTIRALSLVAEIIYGSPASFEDPARYSFAHGGKDGTPYLIDTKTYNQTLEIIEKGIKKSKISIGEKLEAQKRLHSLI